MTCPACKKEDSRLYMREDPYILHACKNCGLVFRQDRVSEVESHFAGGSEVDEAYRKLAGVVDEVNQRLAHGIIEFLRRAGLREGSVLEVGCGTAALGKTIRRSYPDLRYVGIEPTKRFSEHDNRQEASNVFASVAASGIEKHSQAALVMSHVLEHVPDPVEFLASHLLYVKPGGAAYIEVPNEQWKKIFSRLMRFVRGDASTVFSGHINFFTARSLAYALRSAGLEIVRIEKPPIGGSADLIRKLSGDAEIFAVNKKITFIHEFFKVFPLDRLLGYGLVVRAVGRTR